MHIGHLNFVYELPTEDLGFFSKCNGKQVEGFMRGDRHDLTTLQVEDKLEGARVTVKRSVKRLV